MKFSQGQLSLFHHSHGGSEYTPAKPECGGRLEEAEFSPSIGSVADAYNYSMAEDAISTFTSVASSTCEGNGCCASWRVDCSPPCSTRGWFRFFRLSKEP